jgi:apolipoprotein N-acyltransferase
VTRLRSFGQFWWDFVVGDDWLSAVAIVAAIALTAALAHANVSSWWLMPLAVIGVLYLSLRRATRN